VMVNVAAAPLAPGVIEVGENEQVTPAYHRAVARWTDRGEEKSALAEWLAGA
jgi:hypothetical protein